MKRKRSVIPVQRVHPPQDGPLWDDDGGIFTQVPPRGNHGSASKKVPKREEENHASGKFMLIVDLLVILCYGLKVNFIFLLIWMYEFQ